MENPNPTAYGIRLEVLRMAHNDCFQLFEQKLHAIENGKPLIDAHDSSIVRRVAISEKEILDIYPTPEQIKTRASSLYKFVCEKV